MKIVNTSVPKKEVYVKYDNTKVNEKKIIKVLEDAGYKAIVIENVK